MDILKLNLSEDAANQVKELVEPMVRVWEQFSEPRLPSVPEQPDWDDFSTEKDPFYHDKRMQNRGYAEAYNKSEAEFREYNNAVDRVKQEFAEQYGTTPPFYKEDLQYSMDDPQRLVWSMIFAAARAEALAKIKQADKAKLQMQRAVNSAAGVPGKLGDSGIRYSTPGQMSAEGEALAKSFAQFPGSKTTIGKVVQDALYDVAHNQWVLKFITNDQIAEGFKQLKPVQAIHRATQRMATLANQYLETTVQVAKRWRALQPVVAKAMQEVMLRSTLQEMHVSIEGEDGARLDEEAAWKHESNSHLDRKDPKVREAFTKLYAQWNALPAAAKTVYDTVRKDMAKQREDELRALRRSVASQYAGQLRRVLTDDELEKLATADADWRKWLKNHVAVAGNAVEQRALDTLYQQLRDVTSDIGAMRGPYFPLVRFGKHVVVMRSNEMRALEDRARAARDALQQAIDNAPPTTDDTAEAHNLKIAALRKEYNELRKKVEESKKDETKYMVEFYERGSAAKRRAEELKAKNPSADIYDSLREDYYRSLDGVSPSFLKNMEQTLAAALDAGEGVTGEAKATALNAMRDLYLRHQPDRSAMRSELRRMSVEGAQAGEMLRGYVQRARNAAWRISRLTHSHEVTEGLQALSAERRDPNAAYVLNELKARFVGDLAAPDEGTLLPRLQSATYFYHLAFNISYFLTNATQAWTTSLPVMAGRHGIVNTGNSMWAASKDVIALLGSATARSIEENGRVVGLQLRLTDDQIKSLARDEGEARMLKRLTDDGVIDITIKHDLGAISDGTRTGWLGKTVELSGALANFPELYNRLATALAAYRMESMRRESNPDGTAEAPQQKQERAEEYAEKVINRTHFNYSPENAPRVMRGSLGRLVFQFKRYQQGMIYLYAKLIRDSKNGESEAERNEARKGLAYLLGLTTTIGGVVALPIAAPVALALKVAASAYPDDDEPEWLQQWYNGMKDAIGETAAQALAKGLPTLGGVDLSQKLGQGNLLNPVAFAKTDGKKFFSRDYWQEVTFALAGPGMSMLGNEMDAIGMAKAGEFRRAAEKGLPVFAANPLKAYRQADEGLTTKQGDTILSPEEFNGWAIALKSVGFDHVKVTDTYDKRSSFMDALTARQEARKSLLREYYAAVRNNDTDAMQSVQERIQSFNQRQPADNIKGSDLRSSLKQHAKREQDMRMHGGLRVTKRDMDTYNRMEGRE